MLCFASNNNFEKFRKRRSSLFGEENKVEICSTKMVFSGHVLKGPCMRVSTTRHVNWCGQEGIIYCMDSFGNLFINTTWILTKKNIFLDWVVGTFYLSVLLVPLCRQNHSQSHSFSCLLLHGSSLGDHWSLYVTLSLSLSPFLGL